MKPKIYLINILTCLVTILIIVEAAWAQDGASIAVTCSIPEIPGLNAPLIETRALKADAAVSSVITTEEKQLVLNKNNQESVIETSYSR
jgi:hypothetical protein